MIGKRFLHSSSNRAMRVGERAVAIKEYQLYGG